MLADDLLNLENLFTNTQQPNGVTVITALNKNSDGWHLVGTHGKVYLGALSTAEVAATAIRKKVNKFLLREIRKVREHKSSTSRSFH